MFILHKAWSPSWLGAPGSHRGCAVPPGAPGSGPRHHPGSSCRPSRRDCVPGWPGMQAGQQRHISRETRGLQPAGRRRVPPQAPSLPGPRSERPGDVAARPGLAGGVGCTPGVPCPGAGGGGWGTRPPASHNSLKCRRALSSVLGSEL